MIQSYADDYDYSRVADRNRLTLVVHGVATAFVLAEASSRILVLSESDIWEGLFQVPEIARNFMRLFADRFRARSEAMQKSLEQQLRYEHLQKELAIAQDIQLGMLPHDFHVWPEIEVAAEMTPARQVGGDFYDVFPVGPDACCLAIGDVSGKGVPAALFVVRAMALLRAEVLKDQPVNVALSKLNELLCADNPTCMFTTLVVGIIDRQSGVFTYAARATTRSWSGQRVNIFSHCHHRVASSPGSTRTRSTISPRSLSTAAMCW